MKLHILLVAAATTLLSTTLGYKILVVFPVPSRSHDQLAKGLVVSLLKAGHEVTWATPYPEKKSFKNATIIDLSDTQPLLDGVDMTSHKIDKNFVKDFSRNISIITIKNKVLRDTLVKQQFDAVVTEWFFNDLDTGYAAVQQAPWILLSGNILQPYFEFLVDEVRSLATVPNFMHNFPIPMSFWQRVVNVATFAVMSVSDWLDFPKTVALYDQYFGPIAVARGGELPPLQEAIHNISILFVNSHPSVAPARSLPPNVIDIAGFHQEENLAPLPKDIQDILDTSSQGVIYFSMGSILKSSALPAHTRKDLIQILGELPYTVLWKFEEDVQGLPKNVHIRAWWPQPSVLAHPNVKLFITHGGLLSTLESIRYGVPLLAIPVYGDQPGNANRAVLNGYAQMVPFSADMGPGLRLALQEMIRNDSYYNQAKFLSKLYNNRPVSPSKLISHYVELAIESKGAYHLRSKTRLYPWYQRWMLDLLAALVVILYLLKVTVKILFSKVFSKGQSKVKMN